MFVTYLRRIQYLAALVFFGFETETVVTIYGCCVCDGISDFKLRTGLNPFRLSTPPDGRPRIIRKSDVESNPPSRTC